MNPPGIIILCCRLLLLHMIYGFTSGNIVIFNYIAVSKFYVISRLWKLTKAMSWARVTTARRLQPA